MNKAPLAGFALLVALAPALAAHAATVCSATMLCLSDTITNTGTVSSPAETVATTSFPVNGPFSSSISYALQGNAFGGAGQPAVGADFSTMQTGQQAAGSAGSDSGWNFYDDYLFTTTTATSNNATVISDFSMNSISNIEVRIFSTDGNPVPTVGVPGGSVVQGWSVPLSGSNGSLSFLLPTGFPSGNYDLQIRGDAIGANASYGGTLQVDPVPLPAGLPLLVSGMGMLGAVLRRRRLPAIRS